MGRYLKCDILLNLRRSTILSSPCRYSLLLRSSITYSVLWSLVLRPHLPAVEVLLSRLLFIYFFSNVVLGYLGLFPDRAKASAFASYSRCRVNQLDTSSRVYFSDHFFLSLD